MPALYHLLIVIGVAVCMPGIVRAGDMQFDGNILLARFDAGGNDEFHSGKAINVNYNYYLRDWIAADLGLIISEKILDQRQQDIVGYYRASLQTQALMLGIKPCYRFEAPYEVYARLGLQYWYTELEVEEYFAEGIPEGKDSATDNGSGYYLSLGGAYYVAENVVVQLEYRRLEQMDVFEGQSAYPFDLTIDALSFGVGYQF